MTKPLIKLTGYIYGINPEKIQLIQEDPGPAGLEGGLEIVLDRHFIRVNREDKSEVLQILRKEGIIE